MRYPDNWIYRLSLAHISILEGDPETAYRIREEYEGPVPHAKDWEFYGLTLAIASDNPEAGLHYAERVNGMNVLSWSELTLLARNASSEKCEDLFGSRSEMP